MTERGTLVWDSSSLHHPASADRVDVLADLAAPWANVTTAAVLEELDGHGLLDEVLRPQWLVEQRLDGLEALPLLVVWMERLGGGRHHRGEVTVAVACELIGGTALLDDGPATRVQRANGLRVHGTVWLAAQAVLDGRVPSAEALNGFFRSLMDTGARFPFNSAADWGPWAARNGLL